MRKQLKELNKQRAIAAMIGKNSMIAPKKPIISYVIPQILEGGKMSVLICWGCRVRIQDGSKCYKVAIQGKEGTEYE